MALFIIATVIIGLTILIGAVYLFSGYMQVIEDQKIETIFLVLLFFLNAWILAQLKEKYYKERTIDPLDWIFSAFKKIWPFTKTIGEQFSIIKKILN